MQFQPGQSGNIQGRPKGSGRNQLFNELVLPHRESLIEKAITLAKCGNEAMLRLFLERMLPPRPRSDEQDDDSANHEAVLKNLE